MAAVSVTRRTREKALETSVSGCKLWISLSPSALLTYTGRMEKASDSPSCPCTFGGCDCGSFF